MDAGKGCLLALGGAVGALILGMLFLVALLGGAEASCSPSGGSVAQPGVSEAGENTIPANYLKLYQEAGQKYGVGWNVLAGVGKVETNHGRSQLPGVHSGENGAGAGGPMQFIGPTWDGYGVDGNGDGKKDRYNPEDAVPGAANLLKANGASDPNRLRRAIWHYNHADWYVDLVLEWAGKYGSNNFTTGADNASGTQTCQPGAVNGQGGPVVSRVLAFARNQLGTPYQWGGTCTNARKDYASPQNCDCSSLTMRAYEAAGISIPRVTYAQWAIPSRVPKGQEQAGDLVFFRPGSRGPEHVALVVDPVKHTMIHAPSTGDVVRYADYTAGRDPVGFIRPQTDKGNR